MLREIRRMIVGVGCVLVLLATAGPASAAPPIKWPAVTSPNIGTSDNSLAGVACGSPTFCVAVGFFRDTSAMQTLVETWNGSTWSAAAGANSSATEDNQLNGVSCASASFCVAVGNHFDGALGTYQVLIETWDGTAWSVVPGTPNATDGNGATNNHLSGVSCPTTTFCVAVGAYDDSVNGGSRTLVETLNGGVWSLGTSQNLGTFDYLMGVSCVSSAFCVTVGESDVPTSSRTVIESSTDGSSFSLNSSPNSGSGVNGLRGVSCLSTTFCMAVGVAGGGHALAASWDGVSWTIAPSENSSSGLNFLSGVACTQVRKQLDRTAVGSYAVSPGSFRTLVETLKRGSYGIESSANPGTSENFLNAVASLPGGPAFTVGDQSAAGVGIIRTLVLNPR